MLLDLIMPTMGGAKCLKELIEIDPEIKVVVTSGYSAGATVSQSLHLGAKRFIGKPFKAMDLLRQIRKVLDGA